jgi:anti-sigma regulatory factor (Ser/Thr protein kinase)
VASKAIQVVTEHLPATVKAPARARASLAPLRRVLDQPTFSDLALLVSELVTNSVRHASLRTDQQIALKVIVRSQVVQVGVVDPGPGIRKAQGESGGLGFHLLNMIAESWGMSRRDGLTRVWFELQRVSPATQSLIA